jgi:hypothetical protein
LCAYKETNEKKKRTNAGKQAYIEITMVASMVLSIFRGEGEMTGSCVRVHEDEEGDEEVQE